jgi:hypothetical protein
MLILLARAQKYPYFIWKWYYIDVCISMGRQIYFVKFVHGNQTRFLYIVFRSRKRELSHALYLASNGVLELLCDLILHSLSSSCTREGGGIQRVWRRRRSGPLPSSSQQVECGLQGGS